MDRKDAAKQLRQDAAKIEKLATSVESGQDVRRELDEIASAIKLLMTQVYGRRPRAKRGEGGIWKMLALLKTRPNEWIDGSELAHVAGIGEWARRIRELRVQHGWRIVEDEGRYMLMSLTPDADAAANWQLANRIRKQDGSGRSRIEAFLEAKVGEIVDRTQLDYVARIREGSRRVRELRDEHGWPIDSHIDDQTLGVSEYRLVSADPKDRRDPRQRLYPENLRAKIFERDNYTCVKCGRDKAKAEAAGDTRFYLEVHHRKAVAEQLDALPEAELNNEANLVTYCHADHLKETAELQRRRRKERGE